MILWALAFAASAQHVTATGTCPGEIEVSVSGITPTDRYMIARGDRSGLHMPGVASCPEMQLAIDGPLFVGPRFVGVGGTDSLNPIVPFDEGGWVQVIDMASCRVSEVVSVCGTPLEWVGEVAISSGPSWTEDPEPLSCLEMCAENFGGVAESYQCSTRPDLADGMSYVDGWGDTTFCTTPVPDHFSLGSNYDCGFFGCSYSAWVADNPDCADVTNHCFSPPAVCRRLGWKTGDEDWSCPDGMRLPRIDERDRVASCVNASDEVLFDVRHGIGLAVGGCGCGWDPALCDPPSIVTFDGTMCGDHEQLHICVAE